MTQAKNDKIVVDPDLYSENYFLTDNEGWYEYMAGLDHSIHPKFEKALRLANPNERDMVLDIGCGRGELLYYCAKMGAKVLGIDYSKAAIELAKKTIGMLPANVRHLAKVDIGDITKYNFQEKYTIVFMIEIVEHMHGWQLAELFGRINEIITDDGRMIIITPNHYYEKYLSPIKRIVNIPVNLVKWPLRILRGRYKPKDAYELFSKIFKIKVDRGELNKRMHINILSPRKLKSLLHNFDVFIRCEDHSRNIVSMITQKWWGRDIVVIAKKK